MLGHRKLSSEDYLDILRRRALLILLPLVLLPLIALGATFFLTPQFISQTLVIIDHQKVPDEYVKPVISSDLDSRLASMKEQILSRSRIQPIIERYDLYASRGASMDDRLDKARKNIAIKPIHSEIAHTGGLPGFYISFTANDAHTAQLVCGEITSLFLSANLKSREDSAEGTTDFLKSQLADAKRNLDEQDAKLAAFQRQYVGKLPGEEAPNVNMLSSLNTQLEASTQALSRLQQDKAYQESMLAQQIAAASASAPAAGPSAAQSANPQVQQAELQTLLTQESELTNHYTADYPDVIVVRRKIAELRRKMAEPPPAAAASSTTSPSRFDSLPVQQLRAAIRATDIGIQAKRAEQAQTQASVRLYQDRIQASPLVEQQYKELTRDYTTAQKFYDDLLTKMNQSKMATALETQMQGEQFRMLDAPNLPDSPTFPKRWVFAFGGLALGVAFGLLLVAILEYQDTSIRSERDIWAFTRLPTLAVIAYSGDIKAANQKSGKLNRLKQLTTFRKRAAGPPAHIGAEHV